MANTVIAYDSSDRLLGAFFENCKIDLDGFFGGMAISPVFLNGGRLNSLALTALLRQYDGFVFAAFCHGDQDNLLAGGRDAYVSSSNCSYFKKSFVYTFSCHSGKNLGRILIDNECRCFIGYNQEVAIWDTYQTPFISCANEGLKLFYSGQNTLEIHQKMTEKYNEEIDDIYASDFMIASILRANRDALVIHGADISITCITG